MRSYYTLGHVLIDHTTKFQLCHLSIIDDVLDQIWCATNQSS